MALIVTTSIKTVSVPRLVSPTDPIITTDSTQWIKLIIAKVSSGNVFIGTDQNVLQAGFPLSTDPYTLVLGPNSKIYVGTPESINQVISFIQTPVPEIAVLEATNKLINILTTGTPNAPSGPLGCTPLLPRKGGV
jgi:hypothetical protein